MSSEPGAYPNLSDRDAFLRAIALAHLGAKFSLECRDDGTSELRVMVSYMNGVHRFNETCRHELEAWRPRIEAMLQEMAVTEGVQLQPGQIMEIISIEGWGVQPSRVADEIFRAK